MSRSHQVDITRDILKLAQLSRDKQLNHCFCLLVSHVSLHQKMLYAHVLLNQNTLAHFFIVAPIAYHSPTWLHMLVYIGKSLSGWKINDTN